MFTSYYCKQPQVRDGDAKWPGNKATFSHVAILPGGGGKVAEGEVGQGTGGHVTGGAVVGDVITAGVVGQGVHVTEGVV